MTVNELIHALMSLKHDTRFINPMQQIFLAVMIDDGRGPRGIDSVELETIEGDDETPTVSAIIIRPQPDRED